MQLNLKLHLLSYVSFLSSRSAYELWARSKTLNDMYSNMKIVPKSFSVSVKQLVLF